MAKRHIIPLFIPHQGCPNLCVFCDQKKISGAETPVTPEMVTQQIQNALMISGECRELAFYGGSFTAMKPEIQEGLLAAVQPFLRRGEIGAIRLSTRPDAIDDSICQLLQAYGVTTVELGCQSMDPRVLDLSRRGHTPEDTVRAVKCLRQHGFSLILQMMTGLPGDSGQESLETAKELANLEPDGVRIYPTVVLRGTELERQMRAGQYQPQTVEEAVKLCASIYEIFRAAGIPVIRLGLNPTEDLSGGEAVAGAYHPALGELVLSEMYLRRARALLGNTSCREPILLVHPSRVSVMIGQKRRNITLLQEEFGLRSIKVLPEAGELWEITLKNP